MAEQKRPLSYKQASEYLGLPVGTLYAMVNRKRIPHIRLSTRLVRFDQHELAEWIDQHRVGGSSAEPLKEAAP